MPFNFLQFNAATKDAPLPRHTSPVAPVPDVPCVIEGPSALSRVLLVKLSSLGDIAHALPLADALRAALPNTFLVWAVRRRFAALLEDNPALDAVYVLDGDGHHGVLPFGSYLRAQKFDAALDMQGLLVSGMVTRLSGAHLRVGMDWGREGNALFMTHSIVPARERRHMVDKLLQFCDALGVPRQPPRPQIYLANSESERAEALLEGSGAGPRVGFIIGASAPFKTWPPARWAELARRIAAQGAHPVLIDAPGGEDSALSIVREAGGAVALNLAGKTSLRTLASVLARCDVVIGGDSGPLHLAVAQGVPAIGLYGVTDPARTGPQWGLAPAIVLDFNDEVPPHTRRPRHPAVPDALLRIPVAAAADAVSTLLR